MCSFLKGRKLLLYVTEDLKMPILGPTESNEAFCSRFVDCDRITIKIVTELPSNPYVALEHHKPLYLSPI